MRLDLTAAEAEHLRDHVHSTGTGSDAYCGRSELCVSIYRKMVDQHFGARSDYPLDDDDVLDPRGAYRRKHGKEPPEFYGDTAEVESRAIAAARLEAESVEDEYGDGAPGDWYNADAESS